MTDEELQKAILEELPKGYTIITSGKVQKDDIIVIFDVDNTLWVDVDNYKFTIGDDISKLWGVARKND